MLGGVGGMSLGKTSQSQGGETGKRGRGGDLVSDHHTCSIEQSPRNNVPEVSTPTPAGLCRCVHTSEPEVYGSHLLSWTGSKVSSPTLPTPQWSREGFQETPSPCDLMGCAMFPTPGAGRTRTRGEGAAGAAVGECWVTRDALEFEPTQLISGGRDSGKHRRWSPVASLSGHPCLPLSQPPIPFLCD